MGGVGGKEHVLMCAARCDTPKALCKGQRFRFFQTHFGGIAFQGKSDAEEIRRTVISVAFPKADCEVQVPLLLETVFQPHSLCL